MKRFLLLTAFFIFLLPLFSISQVIEWQNTIGGNSSDNLYSIAPTSDGEYILGGSSDSDISGDKTEDSHGGLDYWIVKTDSLGTIQWQNNIGGSGMDYLYSVAQIIDGGYILGGYSYSNISGDKTENSKGVYDYWIVKTDSLGVVLWDKTIGGSGNDHLYSITQTTDGGYISGGYSNSNISGDKTEDSNGGHDCWIVKTDSSGTIQWQNTIGGGSEDGLYSIVQTLDGGYILGGASDSNISGDKTENSNGLADFWIVKINSTGVIQWQNTIGGSGVDWLNSIAQTSDGGYILGGASDSNISGDKTENSNGLRDYWIVKTDSTGIIQWQNTVGGAGYDYLFSLTQTTDGGYFLGGNSNSNISGDKTENSNGSDDFWIVKTDSAGIIQWQNTIGGSGNEFLYSIAQTTDGQYILGGSSSSDISGDKTENSNGQFDYWIVKIAENPTSLAELLNENEILLLYPNPAHSTLTIETRALTASGSKLIVSDVAGRILLTKTLGINSTRHQIDITSFSAGIYFVQVDAGEEISRGRFVKE